MTIRPWTTVDVATLRRDYPNTPTRDLAARLDRTERAVSRMAEKLELKKSREYRSTVLADMLRAAYFRRTGGQQAAPGDNA